MSNEHRELHALIDGYVDGELSAGDRQRMERHLEACERCLVEVESTLALQAQARALPREVAPPRDLWPEIRARLEEAHPAEPVMDRIHAGVIPIQLARQPRPVRWQGWMGRAAAAVALVAISSGVTMQLMRRSAAPEQLAVAPAPTSAPAMAAGPRPDAAPASPEAGPTAVAPPPRGASPAAAARPAASGSLPASLAAFQAGDADYRGAVETLHTAFRQQRGRLSPETVATIERNLGIIDQAIAESQAALRADPSNPEIPLLLSGIYRKKVELLQHAVQLQSRT